MPGVRVLTDSSADIPADLAAAQGILVVPMQVTAGGRSGREGVDVEGSDVLAALAGGLAVTTSQPSAAAFDAAVDAACGDGLVAVHLPATLSGTLEAARAAAGRASAQGVRLEVLDAGTVSMGLGFVALAAARRARAGGSVEEVLAAAQAATRGTQVVFTVDALDRMRRGGRLEGHGGALSARPLLHVVDGAITVLDRVRTSRRALSRLQELAVAAAGDRAVDVAVLHLGGPERATQLADVLRARIPGLTSLLVTEVGAAVAAHTGPGVLGVAVTGREA